MNKITRKISRLCKYRRYRYVVYAADSLRQLTQPRSDLQFEFKQFDAAKLSVVFQTKEPARYRLFKNFLDRGYIGIYCENDRGVPAYGWGMTHHSPKTYYSNNHLQLAAQEGHIFYCYTEEAFRGHNLYPCVIYRLAEELFNHGAHLIWIDTNDDNFPAQRGILKVGFQPYGTMTNYFLFKRRVCSKVRKAHCLCKL